MSSETYAKLTAEMKNCLKSGQKDRLKVVRMLLTEVKNAAINDPTQPGRERTEEEVSSLISSYHKQLSKTILEYPVDRQQELKDELLVVEEFMPKQMDEQALRVWVRTLLAESQTRDFGALMKSAQAALKGQASGQMIASVLKQELAST